MRMTLLPALALSALAPAALAEPLTPASDAAAELTQPRAAQADTARAGGSDPIELTDAQMDAIHAGQPHGRALGPRPQGPGFLPALRGACGHGAAAFFCAGEF